MSAKSRKQNPPQLSGAEWEVMKTFWRQGPQAARDVYAGLPEGHGWAYQTVKTMLSRLVRKGALAYDQIGNSYLYRPVHTREEMTRAATQSFVDRVFDGALKPFAAYCVEEARPEELEAIRRELDRAARAKKGKRQSGGRVN